MNRKPESGVRCIPHGHCPDPAGGQRCDDFLSREEVEATHRHRPRCLSWHHSDGHRVTRPCLALSGVSLKSRPPPRPRWASAPPAPAQAPTACPQCAFRSRTVSLQRLNPVHMSSIITQCLQCLQDPHSVGGVCTVCVPDGILWSRGVPDGAVLTARHGQPLPHLAGGLVLQADAVFLASLVRGSLASRYDGPVQVAALRA